MLSEHAPHPAQTLRDQDAFTDSLIDFVTASPSSYHAAAQVAARLEAAGFEQVSEREVWSQGVPARGYVIRDGALITWLLPARLGPGAAWRIVGTHTDSPALALKPRAATVRDGVQVLGVEIYGGPLLNSFLDRELGLAGRLVTRDGTVHLVRTGPLARVAQVAPHLDRSVNESLHLDKQAHLVPLWSLVDDAQSPAQVPADAPERYLCEVAGIDVADLVAHNIVTYPTQEPTRFGKRQEMLACSRLDNLSSVHAALVALEALAAANLAESSAAGGQGELADAGGQGEHDPIILVANDHEEVGSQTRSGAGGPFLENILGRLATALGVGGDAQAAMEARSICVSADAAHAAHPAYGHLHDPSVRPVLGGGPVVKINAQQRYATDALGVATWARACAAAGVPSQNFVSNNAVPCGSTIGPITATRLGMTTIDVGQALLSMHSQREMCAVADGPMLARALHAYWLGA